MVVQWVVQAHWRSLPTTKLIKEVKTDPGMESQCRSQAQLALQRSADFPWLGKEKTGNELVSENTEMAKIFPPCATKMFPPKRLPPSAFRFVRARWRIRKCPIRQKPLKRSIGPPLVSIGTRARLFRLLRASVRRCGNGFLFSQRPRPVSLWNEVPSHWSHAVGRMRSFYQTLRECWMWKTPFCVVNSLQSHWRRGKGRTFFVECCQRLGPVKDTVLRRELASIIALATRKTKNFLRGMLSAFRAGRCECRRWFSQTLLPGHMLSSVSVRGLEWYLILSSIRRSHWLTGAAGNGAMCNKLKMIALLEKRLELDRMNHGKNGHHFRSLQSFSHVL